MRQLPRTVYRKFTSMIGRRTLPRESVGELLFGQQHVGTQSFFEERFDQYHTIPLKKSPHYRLLQDHLASPLDDNPYLQYLKASWDYYYPGENTQERREDKVKKFLGLYETLGGNGRSNAKPATRPVVVCRRPDGRVIIVEGNHRAAIALKQRRGLRVVFIPASQFLRTAVTVPDEFFGTKRLNRPYQSLFFRGKELVKGRRRDLLQRINRVSPADLTDKTVLDLGCNYGATCYLAGERAKAVIGVELSPQIASCAVRLNAYFCSPCRFLVHDLNEELTGVPPHDTVFCFALVKHLTSTNGIVATIRKLTKKVLYFEGHAGTAQEDYPYLLNSGIFSAIDCIGYGADGVHTRRRTRPLFRCEV